MAGADLALETMRVRQSALSSSSAWLVKRGMLSSNPVARLDRPPHRREPRNKVPGSAIWTRWCRRSDSGAANGTWPYS
jgi:site-specific recombinase XerC